MRVIQATDDSLLLRGRRVDGEVGEQGLWLLWVVGFAVAAGGAAFAVFVADTGALVMGSLVGLAGAAGLGFGLHRLLRRESLEIDAADRELIYAVRSWPGPRREELRASFDQVKEIRVRRSVESPGAGRHGPSVAYEVFEARLLVKPRAVIPLERSQDEQAVRSLAERVAGILGVAVSG